MTSSQNSNKMLAGEEKARPLGYLIGRITGVIPEEVQTMDN
jgi:hypothetical protein